MTPRGRYTLSRAAAEIKLKSASVSAAQAALADVAESMHDRAVAYAHISIDGDTLCLTFREVSVDDGADVSEFSFGIRKTKKM